MRDTSSPLPPAAATLLRNLWTQVEIRWSHLQLTAYARRITLQIHEAWNRLPGRDRFRIAATSAVAGVLLLGVKACTRSATEHPAELVIEYTVNGQVEKRTPIKATFCAINRDTGRLEIGWKRESHIRFNQVWLGYDVGYEEKERQMFGYYQSNTNYVISTQPENGEYFLSVSLKDFPAAKYESVRAVTLKFNLSEQVEYLAKNIQEAVDHNRRVQALKTFAGGMAEVEKNMARKDEAIASLASSKLSTVFSSLIVGAEDDVLPDALNEAAWFLATYPVDAIRDGKKALEYSSFFLEKPEWQNGSRLDTLAAAHAETGDFENAVKYQTQAVEKATSDERENFSSRLRLYMNKKAFRHW